MPLFRPRLRFSLRTLFVLVTLVGFTAAWFANEWRIVRNREAVLLWMETLPKSKTKPGPKDLEAFIPHWEKWGRGEHNREISWFRWQLYDSPMCPLLLGPELSPEDRKRIGEAFPESAIIIVTGK